MPTLLPALGDSARARIAFGAAARAECRETALVAAAVAHGAALAAAPSILLIALGLWWNANTVAHNFIHRPFFVSRGANRAFSAYLTAVLGFPAAYWRERHLAHHAGRRARVRLTPELALEIGICAGVWVALGALAPKFLAAVYVPGILLGLVLCWLQGRYEHLHGTRSHYGALYNCLFFNDGYHVEHHAHPGASWARLPNLGPRDPAPSRWPAVLRWLEGITLDGLERLTLPRPWLQRFVVERHARAFARLTQGLEPLERVTIVGGGLFPRTALVLRRLAPAARLTVVDQSAESLAIARAFLDPEVTLLHARWEPGAGSPEPADLVVIPLAFRGDRAALYRQPPGRAILVHDWIWRARGRTSVVSWLLLKRLNLVGP